jgi:septum formation protein
MKIVLASKSPRRRDILENLGIKFTVKTADVDETSSETDPLKYSENLAIKKGKAVSETLDADTLVISSDTVVEIDGKILGKPKSTENAKEMLNMLSGKPHTVASGISLILNGKCVSGAERTTVYFSELDEKTIEYYVATGEPMDKAGAYGIQGKVSLWIDKIDGCYNNVVGFPTRLFCKLLEELCINISDIT